MGKFDTFADSPNAIKNEGQEISLKFEKTGPDTGRLSWNIPPPSQGCSSQNQAYCGIVLTYDNTQTNISKTPTDGVIYIDDNTLDKDLHAGDTIGSSIVIASINDKETLFLDIEGLSEDKQHFFSGFATDKQFRYHTPGVHSYSVDLSSRNATDSTNGCQSINVSDVKISPTDLTNLITTDTFIFDIAYDIEGLDANLIVYSETDNCDCISVLPTSIEYHNISINGSSATTYQNLLDSINLELKKLDNPFNAPTPPNTLGYYWDTEKLYQWDGYKHVEQTIIFENSDPTINSIGDLWYNGTNIFTWDGSTWVISTYIDSIRNPNELGCSDYWYNGTNIYSHDGNIWCATQQYTQNLDPSLPTVLDCGSFWYDSNNLIVRKLDDSNTWNTIDVLYWDTDPNNLTIGTLWYNINTNQLKIWNGISFDNLIVVTSETAPIIPIANQYWYDPINQVISEYNSLLSLWVEIPTIIDINDPSSRESCDIWWNSSTNIFSIWDITTLSWVNVPLIESPIDPISKPIIEKDSIWINGQTYSIWDGMCWVTISAISWPTDPTIRTLNELWFDGSQWYQWNNTNWVIHDAIESLTAPTSAALPLNTLWFNPTTNILQFWNGISWVQIAYSNTSLTPTNGTLWLNTSTSELFEWFKNKWNISKPKIVATLTDLGFKFCSSTTGHDSNIAINQETDTLFPTLDISSLTQYGSSNLGTDGVSSDPLYAQLGVGTDGDEAPRRELIDAIRHQLGYPQVQVEISKQQFDYCIDGALEELRKRTSIAYTRGYFFLDLVEGKQRYAMTHTGNGFNKIVNIEGIFRNAYSGFGGNSGNSVFDYANTQYLYGNQGGYDLVSHHLFASFAEELETLSASKILFQFNSQTRDLDIFQRTFGRERVLIDCITQRTEQDMITDYVLKPWIESYAMAMAMIILSQIRGKYATLPGANGVQLNSQDLYVQAQDMITSLIQEIDDYIVESPVDYGIGAIIQMG